MNFEGQVGKSWLNLNPNLNGNVKFCLVRLILVCRTMKQASQKLTCPFIQPVCQEWVITIHLLYVSFQLRHCHSTFCLFSPQICKAI